MSVKKNITSIFMVPTLKIPKDQIKENGFINAYISDSRREVQYKDCIHLLFRPTNLDKFREFVDSEYERTKDLIEDYDYENGLVVLVYKLDSKYKKDFDIVRQGQYSKTSKKFQDLFSKTVKIERLGLHKDEISLQYRIFQKSKELIMFWEEKLDVTFEDDQEVWDGFEEVNEVLNIDKIKEHV